MVAAGFLALALTACGFQASFDQTRYRCGAGSACPDGFSCQRGFCEAAPRVEPDAPTSSSDPDASEVIDAGAATDATPGPSIDASIDASGGASIDAPSAAPRFEDPFDDGVLAGWAPWDHPGCTVAESGGFLELSFTGSGDAYCGADTVQRFDLRGGAISVEVAAAPPVASFESYVVLFDGQQQIQMVRDRNGLTMQLKNAGTVSKSATIANDLTAHRHWRIREQGGSIVWETSPDGATWTQRHSAANSLDVHALQIELAAGQSAPGPGSPVIVHFDHCVVL